MFGTYVIRECGGIVFEQLYLEKPIFRQMR